MENIWCSILVLNFVVLCQHFLDLKKALVIIFSLKDRSRFVLIWSEQAIPFPFGIHEVLKTKQSIQEKNKPIANCIFLNAT